MSDCPARLCDGLCGDCVRAVEARERAYVRTAPVFDGEVRRWWIVRPADVVGVTVLLALIVGVAWLTALV